MSEREQVAAAAGYLDRAVPGWAQQIDTETLHLADSTRCIAGQLNRPWTDLRMEVEDATGVRMNGVFSTNEYYRDHWIAEIEARCAPTKVRLRDKAKLALSAVIR